MGSSTVQNPSMLDNVSQDDFSSPDPSAQPSTPATPLDPTPVAPVSTPAPTTPTRVETVTSEHQITTDNPFVTSPEESSTDSSTPSAVPAPADTPAPVSEPTQTEPAASTSGPVAPPVVSDDDAQDQTGYIDALSNADSTDGDKTTEPVDHDKLASMKQEALAHLEPLADHIGGTPEETFKTTMMMIQANDNHTLLEKALESAKKIEDDKIRAQAMLDIINEINYFAQTSGQ
jgi:hypothetical protein